jgi:hypothetical protein
VTGATLNRAVPDVSGAARSVQSYIDETPFWSDGAAVHSDDRQAMAHLDPCGRREVFRGTRRFHDRRRDAADPDGIWLGKAEHGVVGAASLFGILIGAIGLGRLSDFFGRKRGFRRGFLDLFQAGYDQGWFGVCSRGSERRADHH